MGCANAFLSAAEILPNGVHATATELAFRHATPRAAYLPVQHDRCRPSALFMIRGVINSNIHRASTAGTKCNVPRMGHVRTIVRSAIARSTSMRVALGMRNAIDQSAPW